LIFNLDVNNPLNTLNPILNGNQNEDEDENQNEDENENENKNHLNKSTFKPLKRINIKHINIKHINVSTIQQINIINNLNH